jgi:formate hydrogenlyase subunit 3/multisubunit Na+/H+ antiporter MnhD subunit
MPSDGALSLTSSAVSSVPSGLAGFVGPIIPGIFAIDDLSLVILVSLGALATLLILVAPATGTFFRHVVMILFFFFGAFGVVTAVESIAFFATWEITALFAWGIAQLAGDSQQVEEGIAPFQAAGLIGSFAMFLGLALLAGDRRSLAFGPLAPGSLPAIQVWPISALILVALFFKTYGMLSEAWSIRPTHQFALTGATLGGAGVLAIGIYPFLRFFGPILGGLADWEAAAFWGGAGIAVVGGLAALGEPDYRRALSYGVLSQIGFLVALFAAPIPGTRPGILAVAIGDAFAFTGLFICVGAAQEATAEVLVRKVGGLLRGLPVTAFLYLLCVGAVIGLPPFGGYIAHRDIALAAAASPRLLALGLVVAALTLIYLLRLFAAIFLGAPRGPSRPERVWPMLLMSGGVVATLAFATLLAPAILGVPGPGGFLGG